MNDEASLRAVVEDLIDLFGWIEGHRHRFNKENP